jgi:hypothetical protein
MRLDHISHGFYRVSDRDAARLAKDVGRALPKHGYELGVVLPNGLEAWLARTPTSSIPEMPKRGWSWSVHRRAGKEWTPMALGASSNRSMGTYRV